MAEVAKLNTKQLMAFLMDLHPPSEWAFIPELRIGVGYGKDSEQRFDAWAISYQKGNRNKSVVYEIKASRGDLLSELSKPKKRRPGLLFSNEFYFVTPKGLCKITEIPPETGLIEIDETGKCEIVINAPYRDSVPSWQLMASISKRFDELNRANYLRDKSLFEERMAKEMVSGMVVDRHLEKWRNHNVGSREIPDKIVDALEDVDFEIRDILSYQKKGAKNV
jgi:hypothetical protein